MYLESLGGGDPRPSSESDAGGTGSWPWWTALQRSRLLLPLPHHVLFGAMRWHPQRHHCYNAALFTTLRSYDYAISPHRCDAQMVQIAPGLYEVRRGLVLISHLAVPAAAISRSGADSAE